MGIVKDDIDVKKVYLYKLILAKDLKSRGNFTSLLMPTVFTLQHMCCYNATYCLPELGPTCHTGKGVACGTVVGKLLGK